MSFLDEILVFSRFHFIFLSLFLLVARVSYSGQGSFRLTRCLDPGCCVRCVCSPSSDPCSCCCWTSSYRAWGFGFRQRRSNPLRPFPLRFLGSLPSDGFHGWLLVFGYRVQVISSLLWLSVTPVVVSRLLLSSRRSWLLRRSFKHERFCTYPLSRISASIRSSLCYIFMRFLTKIDMSTCRSVQDMFKTFRTSRRSRLLWCSFRLERFRSYPLSWISASMRSSLCYISRRFLFKIGMSTCRSVQDAPNLSGSFLSHRS